MTTKTKRAPRAHSRDHDDSLDDPFESLPDAPFDALGHALLDAEAEVALAKRMEAGSYAASLLTDDGGHDDATTEELEWLAADGLRARDEFINSNLRLALSASRKYRGRGYTDDDTLQDAYHGLVKAVDRFDYTKGYRFSTYAMWWIRESIMSGLRAAAFVERPEVLWNQMVKVRAIRLRLLDETGQMPTAEEIAAESARDKQRKPMSVREVQRCLHEDRTIVSLDVPIGDEEDMSFGDLIADDYSTAALTAIDDALDRAALALVLDEVLANLDETAAAIIRARFGMDGRPPRGVNTVAEELGIPRATVRNRERSTMRTLRDPAIKARLRGHLTAA